MHTQRWQTVGLAMLLGLAIGFGLTANARAGENEEFFAAYERAQALAAKGEYSASAAQYERALELSIRDFGKDAENTATILDNLANAYTNMDEHAKAEPLFLRGLEIRKTRLGPDHPNVAVSLNNLGFMYTATGQYAKAEPLFRRALEIWETKLGPRHTYVADCLGNLADLRFHTGQYTEADTLWRRSLKIYEANFGPDDLAVANCLNNIAETCRETGRFAEAESLYLRSLQIKAAKLEPEHPLVALTLNNLATLYSEMGQFAKAEPLFLRALKLREARLGPDHVDVAATVTNLALMYIDMGRYAEAEPLCERGLQIHQAILGPNHPSVANSLTALANVYYYLRQYEKAEPRWQRCAQIYESSMGPAYPGLATVLSNLALMNYKLGEYAKAEPLDQRSLEIREGAFGPDHPATASSLHNFGLLHAAQGATQLAAEDFERERRGVRRHVASVLPALSEQDQLTFLERSDQKLWHVALSLAQANPRDPKIAARSAGWVLNGKGLSHEALATQKLLVRDSKNPAVAAKVRALRQIQSQLAGLSQRIPSSEEAAAHRRKLTDLSDQAQELEREVNRAAGRPALADPWIEPDAARKALAAEALLVDIVRFEPAIFGGDEKKGQWKPARYVAWLTPPAGVSEIKVVDLGPAAEIERAVEQVRAGMADAMGSPDKPGQIAEQGEPEAAAALSKPLAQLAELTLAPILKEAGNAKQLILSPDAALWLVPWGALPLANGRYAVEAYQIRYVVTGRDLVLGIGAKQVTGPPVIMADPNFDLGATETQAATRAVLRGAAPVAGDLAVRSISNEGSLIGHVDRLPGTATEAKAIEPKLSDYAHAKPTLYTDQYALEGVFTALQRPRVLVMSTHGFFLPDQELKPDDSPAGHASAGSETRGAALTASGKPLENPLLRCGLLLAGCNHRGNGADSSDGVLTGMEIVGTDLRGTDLVVLSACETGLGQVRNGEGVAGLRQAFQLAGAKAVVATLWQIPDKQSAQLMSDFFTNLAAGQGKAEALQSAQLKTIEARRAKYGAAHPFFWAAYTVTGN